jgi:hypothetical protein
VKAIVALGGADRCWRWSLVVLVGLSSARCQSDGT